MGPPRADSSEQTAPAAAPSARTPVAPIPLPVPRPSTEPFSPPPWTLDSPLNRCPRKPGALYGIQFPDDTAQTQAALGLLSQASRAIRESRTQLDRLYSRVSELQATGKSFPRTGGQGTAISATELWAEIKALAPEADAMLNAVATHVIEAAEALSGASSAAHHPWGQEAQGPGTAQSHSKEADTPDEITRRDDVWYRY